jgi:hypothetical protein
MTKKESELLKKHQNPIKNSSFLMKNEKEKTATKPFIPCALC